MVNQHCKMSDRRLTLPVLDAVAVVAAVAELLEDWRQTMICLRVNVGIGSASEML